MNRKIQEMQYTATYGVFVRLTATMQAAFYHLAMTTGKYSLAYNLADHANYKRLDVDLMLSNALRKKYQRFGI